MEENVEDLGFLGLQSYTFGHGGGDAYCVFLQVFSGLGYLDEDVALVGFHAASCDVAFLLKFFQEGSEGSAVKIQVLAQFLYVHLLFFPKDHHRDVLGVGEVQLFQKWFVPLDDFL